MHFPLPGPRRLSGLAAALGVAAAVLLSAGCERRDVTETGNAVRGESPNTGTGTGTSDPNSATGTTGTTGTTDTGAVAPPLTPPIEPASAPVPAASQ